jgi:hypothetical protein
MLVFYGDEMSVSLFPNPQAGGSLNVGCPRLFIEYNRGYPPRLLVVSSIRTCGRAMPWSRERT